MSAQGPLVLGFWVWGLGVWGLGLPMVIDDDNDEELTWHSLPTRVTRSQIKTKKPHKLNDSIKNNVFAARKHEKTMF